MFVVVDLVLGIDFRFRFLYFIKIFLLFYYVDCMEIMVIFIREIEKVENYNWFSIVVDRKV